MKKLFFILLLVNISFAQYSKGLLFRDSSGYKVPNYSQTTVMKNFLTDAWNDLSFPFISNRVNPTSSKPVFDVTELTLNFENDSVNCIMYMVGQMPHNYKIGSAIYPHVHIKGNTDSAYIFRLAYKWINIGDTANAGWSYINMGTRAATTPSNTVIHQILSSSTPITASDSWGESKGISSMLMMKIYRVDALAPTIVKGYAFDLHYQLDGFGSRQEYIK